MLLRCCVDNSVLLFHVTPSSANPNLLEYKSCRRSGSISRGISFRLLQIVPTCDRRCPISQVTADGELKPAVCNETPRDIHQFQLLLSGIIAVPLRVVINEKAVTLRATSGIPTLVLISVLSDLPHPRPPPNLADMTVISAARSRPVAHSGIHLPAEMVYI